MKRRTIISFILVICILISSFNLYSAADDNTQMPSAIQVTDTVSDISEIIPVSLQELYKQDCIDSLSDSILFDYIDRTLLEKSEVVARLDSFEELNTYVFLNYDGTQTVFYLNDNVKYIDKDGTVIEKDLDLVRTDHGYRTKQNDVGLYMPDNLSEGIVLSYGEKSLSIRPIDMQTDKAVISGNSLMYSNIRYTPTIDGVKEEIILESKPEEGTVYCFYIDSAGMKLFENENGLYFAESEESEECFVISDIFMYDSLLNFSEGTVSAKEYEEGYLLTVIPDCEFLSDAAYPVVIDPSFDFSDTTHGSNAIQDAPVFSGRPNGNAGNYLYNRVGVGNDDYAIGRTAVRLQSFITSSYYINSSAGNITSAEFFIKDASGSSATTLKLYALANTTWTETGVTWNNIGTIGSTAYGTNTGLSYGNWTSFDITNLVLAWKNGTESANAGFIIKGADEVTVKDKAFISSEYTSDTSARPYIRFTYSSTTLSLNRSVLDLAEGETFQLIASAYPMPATVTWNSLNAVYATISNNGLVTGVKAGSATVYAFDGSNLAVCSVRVHVPDGVYSFKNSGSQLYMSANENVYESDIYQSSARGDNKTQLWRVEHIGAGQEKISPVYKPELQLISDATNEVMVDDQGAVYWTFEWAAAGYRFKKAGANQYVQPYGLSGGSNVSLVTGASSSSNYMLWMLTKQTSRKCGLYFYDTETGNILTESDKVYLAPEESKLLSDMDIAIYVYDSYNISASQSFDAYIGHTAKCTSEVLNGDVRLTGVEKGQTFIVAYTTIGGLYRSVSIYIQVTEIPNGLYFMQNRQNNKWAKVYQDNAVNNQNVVQYDFNGSHSEVWYFLLQNRNGYYIVRSMLDINHMYLLGVEDDSTAVNSNIVLRETDDMNWTNGVLWRIESTTDGAYRVIPKTGDNESNLLVLATSTSESSNNQNLIQGEYIDNTSYRDEWWLFIFNDVRCIGIQDETHPSCDHTSTFPTIMNALNNRGFHSYEEFEKIHALSLVSAMASSKIIVVNSHGTKTKLILNDTEFTVTLVNSLPSGAFDNIKLTLFVACETGKDGVGANNLVNAVSDKGAELVIGFEKVIYCAESDIWVNAFFNSLGGGNTVCDAICAARQSVELNWSYYISTDMCYFVGDANQTINNN